MKIIKERIIMTKLERSNMKTIKETINQPNKISMDNFIKEIDNNEGNHFLYLARIIKNDEIYCKIGITKNLNECLNNIPDINFKYISVFCGNMLTVRGLESLLNEEILDSSQRFISKENITECTGDYNYNYRYHIESFFNQFYSYDLK